MVYLGTKAVEERTDIRRNGRRGLVDYRQDSILCGLPVSVAP